MRFDIYLLTFLLDFTNSFGYLYIYSLTPLLNYIVISMFTFPYLATRSLYILTYLIALRCIPVELFRYLFAPFATECSASSVRPSA